MTTQCTCVPSLSPHVEAPNIQQETTFCGFSAMCLLVSRLSVLKRILIFWDATALVLQSHHSLTLWNIGSYRKGGKSTKKCYQNVPIKLKWPGSVLPMLPQEWTEPSRVCPAFSSPLAGYRSICAGIFPRFYILCLNLHNKKISNRRQNWTLL